MTTATTDLLGEVRGYYDANTPEFERFGQGRATHTIHRAVWGPGVRSREEAFLFPEELVLREVRALATRFPEPLQVLDLGCGIGQTLLHLSSRANVVGMGVTLSGVQAERGRQRIRDAGLDDRLDLVEGNFLDLPGTVKPAHLALSIEAFIHGPDPAAYFASAARHVASGGVLLVCDDFCTERATGPLSPREQRCLDEVRRGWLANTLVTVKAADSIARAAGFRLIKDVDLTPYLELRRPRDLLIAAAVALGRRWGRGYRFRSLLGGNALQQGLLSGLLEFHFVAWQRDATPPAL